MKPDAVTECYLRTLEMIEPGSEISDAELLRHIDEAVMETSTVEKLSFLERKKCREAVFAAFRRLDILSIAMDDPEVTEIMVNGADNIFVEKNGAVERYRGKFIHEQKLADVVQQIASDVNRRVNEASPMVDARLSDGSRVNIVLPPVSLSGPCVTIRRFSDTPISMRKLIDMGSITAEAAQFLRTMVECGYNIFISGGTGAGKTTFLGALSEYIPRGERVITIEDSAELRLSHVENLVRLESRPPNMEGQYEITIRDLIRNALRMRPDRIIVGEVRGGEALDMLQAMNTGHDGSISTGHANSASDMIARIETMVLMGMELPLPAIREQIASGIDIMVHLGRLRDKSRRVLGIYEICGVRKDKVQLAELFSFREEGYQGDKIIGHLVKSENDLQRKEKLFAKGGTL